MRHETEVRPVLQELSGMGCRAAYVQGDVSRERDRRELFGQAMAMYGRLDVLVNNAGIAPPERKDILEATEESFDLVMNTNLKGPYFLTQLIANQMICQKKESPSDFCCIINVSSVSAVAASVNRGEYCISKAGVAMATRLWAVRLGEYDIPVYEIRPGIIQTDMTAGVKEKYDRLFSQGLALQPRWGTPADVGRVAAALATGSMAYSTGQVIDVGGGMTVNRF
jgi:NAD(P)-dependent dehydrogenase (short-subunit alcohol dehydrogenase family)